jgi:hypothetical protein
MQQMGRYLMSPIAKCGRRHGNSSLADGFRTPGLRHDFDEMGEAARSIAAQAVFESFRDYQFRAYERFD